jgi:hypothetical protein
MRPLWSYERYALVVAVLILGTVVAIALVVEATK